MLKPTRFLRHASSKANTWTETLNLPRTTFPARPTAQDVLKYRQRCADDLYSWQKKNRPGKDEEGEDNKFVLHDGPPYANGNVHVGHALNKILKDLIIRTNLSAGKRVEYRPGWDCHGLPIELKALQAHAAERAGKSADTKEQVDSGSESDGAKQSSGMSALNIRGMARELAAKTVEDQKASFRAWGVMGDWDTPYLTMDKEFEVRQLRVFKDMVAKDLIYRQHKPVHWSPSSRTALAEAELEYDENHRVTAAFVKFPITKLSSVLANSANVKKDELSALIWTTTPWTLPANKAIGVNPEIMYMLVELQHESASSSIQGQMLVAKERLDSLLSHLPEGTTTKIIMKSIPGSALANGTEYINVISGETCRVISADFITSTSGTGLVHMAPGHGMDDYNVLTKLNIGPAFAPVDDDGKFTADAFPNNPEHLKGLYVETKGAKAVLEMLETPTAKPLAAKLSSNSSLVLATHDLRHKNPIDWRTKRPVITRATYQWFADVGKVRDSALEALDLVEFIPESGKTRLASFLKGRSHWCISRQRAWGVPIPALFNKTTGDAIMTGDSVDHIINVIEKRGSNAWWSDAEDDPAWLAPGLEPGTYVRGKDTMDVWFDSGSSWTSLAERKDEMLADVYVEGTDQHRGWFQSSLLTYVASDVVDASVPPFKTLITHGFTLDSEGRKMSKSLGNVVTPEEILTGSLLPTVKGKGKAGTPPPSKSKDVMGPDVLRLWVASSDYTKDVVIGQQALQSVHRDLQKYRITLKWLLGVLNDYPVAGPQGELLGALGFADHVVMHRLAGVSAAVFDHNQKYEFHKSVSAINRFINADLSAFYFEVVKDRTYAGDAETRLHTQTILYLIMNELMHMLTPICPHLVAEVWEHMPESQTTDEIPHPLHRIWDAPFNADFDSWNGDDLEQNISTITTISAAVKVAQEDARRRGRLGSGLACDIEIQLPDGVPEHVIDLLSDLEAESELAELLVVSGAEVVPADPAMKAEWEKGLLEDEDTKAFLEEKLVWRNSVAWQHEAEFVLGDIKGKVLVLPPRYQKCARCWQFTAEKDEELCERCVDVLDLGGQEGDQQQQQQEEEDEYVDNGKGFRPDDGGLAKEMADGMDKSLFQRIFGKKP